MSYPPTSETPVPTSPAGFHSSEPVRDAALSVEATGGHFGRKRTRTRPRLTTRTDAGDHGDVVAGTAMRVVRGSPTRESVERWSRRGERVASWLFNEWERERRGDADRSQGRVLA